MRLDTTERRIMESRGSRHTLIIRKVQASDFANYTCMADNQIGKTRQKLELSGRCSHYTGCSNFGRGEGGDYCRIYTEVFGVNISRIQDVHSFMEVVASFGD
jgi:hypothetical protein